MKPVFLPFNSGNFAEFALRNRGRLRNALKGVLMRKLQRTYAEFLDGEWIPPQAKQDSNFCISMTSWGPRLQVLPLVLVTLIQQIIKPKEIIVWLTRDDHERMDVKTQNLFMDYQVTFRVCDDLKSHKKWLPMIEQGCREPFVICDDDIFYPRDWFSSLIAEDRENCFVGLRAHEMKTNSNGTIAPYFSWPKLIQYNNRASHSVFITGGAGAVIRPERTTSYYTDRERIFSTCPDADDIWLNALHRASGIPGFKTQYSFPCLELPGTDESGLANSNLDQGGNDEQIKRVEAIFKLNSYSDPIS